MAKTTKAQKKGRREAPVSERSLKAAKQFRDEMAAPAQARDAPRVLAAMAVQSLEYDGNPRPTPWEELAIAGVQPSLEAA